jgi:hypothetical protein
MAQLFGMLIVVPLLGFWIWMFQDMINNQTIPEDAKNTWRLMFIVMNVFAAGYYYFNVYKNTH